MKLEDKERLLLERMERKLRGMRIKSPQIKTAAQIIHLEEMVVALQALRVLRTTALLLLVCAVSVKAQVPSGFTKIATVTSTTYTDSACPHNAICAYIVTAYNSAGEGQPSNYAYAKIPASGSHTVVLNWSANSNTCGGNCIPAGYYVYEGPPPPAPALGPFVRNGKQEDLCGD